MSKGLRFHLIRRLFESLEVLCHKTHWHSAKPGAFGCALKVSEIIWQYIFVAYVAEKGLQSIPPSAIWSGILVSERVFAVPSHIHPKGD